MNNETERNTNYFLALFLSMLVLLGYSFYLQKVQPKNVVRAKTESSPSLEKKETPETTFFNQKDGSLSPLFPPKQMELRNDIYEADISTLGGTITRLIYKGESLRSGSPHVTFFQGDPLAPGIFSIQLANEEIDLSRVEFQVTQEPHSSDQVDMVYEKAGEYRLTKSMRFSRNEPILALDVRVENLSDHQKKFPIILNYGLYFHSEFLSADGAKNKHREDMAASEAVVLTDKIKEMNESKLAKKPFVVTDTIKWSGLIKKYFALLVKPDWSAVSQEASVQGDQMLARLSMEPLVVPARAASEKKQFFIYAGPQRYEVLKSFGVGFEDLLSRGMLGAFKIILLKTLKFFNQYTHNFGWAIILLTIVIKGLFAPLTHMSFSSMRKMQTIQPKLKSLQERYKNDPTKLNQAMMELYKKNKVNPMGGCLPMVLQIPIFIAFYQMLSGAIELKGAPFIGWVHDLAQPDTLASLPFSLPILGNGLHLLPIIMAGSMVLQQRLTPNMGSSPEQTKMMNTMMPIMFGFMFYQMPSGLVLYWLVNNVLSIIHQGLVKPGIALAHHDDEA